MNIKNLILGLTVTLLLAGCSGSSNKSTSGNSNNPGGSSTSSPSSQSQEEINKKLGITPVYDEANDTATYGLYPQTHVSDTKTIAALDALKSAEKNGWYLYNGEYYAKSAASPNESNYTFSDGTTIVSNTEYWFKCELITWKVLKINDDVYTLYSNALLDAHRYDDNYNMYEYCEIRDWLNNVFLSAAFNLGSSHLETTEVDNSSSTTDTLNSNPNKYSSDTKTFDKVFMPCFKDYLNEEFGFPSDRKNASSARQAKPTDYALAKNCYQSNNCGSYWTRSPASAHSTKVWLVQYDGQVLDTTTVEKTNVGVRPAIAIKF